MTGSLPVFPSVLPHEKSNWKNAIAMINALVSADVKCFNVFLFRNILSVMIPVSAECKNSEKPKAMQMNLFDLLCRGVNRISGEAEYRRSREWHGVPRKERTGARFVPGESATISRQIDSLPPEGRARYAGRMAIEPIARFLPRGKVLRFRGKSVHFSPRRQMYACRTSMTDNTVLCFILQGWNCL